MSAGRAVVIEIVVPMQLELSVTGKVDVLESNIESTDSTPEVQTCLNSKGQNVPCELGIGTNHCQCYACKRFFWSVGAFDKHQRMINKRIACLDPEDIGMVKNARGWWVTALNERDFG